MLTTLRARLLDGMEIKKVREKPSKYEITFLIDGKEYQSEIYKACAPGMQDRIVDQTLFNVMSRSALSNGDIESAKQWLDRITHHSFE